MQGWLRCRVISFYLETKLTFAASSHAHLHRNIKTNSKYVALSTNRLFQVRFIHATMARPLTGDERARVKAYLDAGRKAMAEITENDLDRIREARAAVMQAHPIDAALREKYSAELLKSMADPLDGMDKALNCPFLKPDAPWGLVVYRGSYSDDAAWEHMLAQINENLKESLEINDRQALLARHQLVVMNDRSQFDGATPDQVREHFSKWAVDELRLNWRDQPIPDDQVAEIEAGDGMVYSAGTRYNFCLLVDDVCLESLAKMSSPVVKLVKKHWVPDEQDLGEKEGEGDNPGWEEGVTNNEFEDMGWMYIYISDYMDIQNSLYEGDNWADDYIRPPLMRFESEFETAPGFWRRNRKSSD